MVSQLIADWGRLLDNAFVKNVSKI